MRADLLALEPTLRGYAQLGRLQWVIHGSHYSLQRRIGTATDGFWLPVASFIAPDFVPLDVVVESMLGTADVMSGRFTLAEVLTLVGTGFYKFGDSDA